MEETIGEITETLIRARNAYNSSAAASAAYISGKTVQNRKHDERRLRNLLWGHRDVIIDFLRDNVS